MNQPTFPGWTAILHRLADHDSLTQSEARQVVGEILSGEATDAQIAATIVALRMKGETIDELVGFREAMLTAAMPLELPDDAVDIVGMGGTRSRRASAFNVSTIASFVAAAAGAVICKHGNRKASSTSGSTDVLEALGVNVEIPPEAVSAAVHSIGVGFANARTFHPAMRHVAGVRSELGVPSVFNVLGPVSHPGRVHHQVLGVADPILAPRIADVLAATGARYSLVVTGHDQTDELSITGPSDVIEVRNGSTRSFRLDASEYGVDVAAEDEVGGGDAATNAGLARAIFAGDERGARRDMVVVNAAAALLVSGKCGDLQSGIEQCRQAIDDGAAAEKLAEYARFSNDASLT